MDRARWILGLGGIAIASHFFACSNDRPPASSDTCTPTSGQRCARPPAIGGTGSSSCGLSTSNETCNDCITQDCCDVDKACAANTACVALAQCLTMCIVDGSTSVDPSCVAACQSEGDAGVSDYTSLTSCIQSGCPICD